MIEAWAVKLAALWAQQIGLPRGNYWEPAVARNIVTRYRAIAGDADDLNVRAFVEAEYRRKLGLGFEKE